MNDAHDLSRRLVLRSLVTGGTLLTLTGCGVAGIRLDNVPTQPPLVPGPSEQLRTAARQQCTRVLAAMGLQPHDAIKPSDATLASLAQILRDQLTGLGQPGPLETSVTTTATTTTGRVTPNVIGAELGKGVSDLLTPLAQCDAATTYAVGRVTASHWAWALRLGAQQLTPPMVVLNLPNGPWGEVPTDTLHTWLQARSEVSQRLSSIAARMPKGPQRDRVADMGRANESLTNAVAHTLDAAGAKLPAAPGIPAPATTQAGAAAAAAVHQWCLLHDARLLAVLPGPLRTWGVMNLAQTCSYLTDLQVDAPALPG